MAGVWDELKIESTDDVRVIRKAYTQRLKEVHPEDDPDGCQRLRAAYEQALMWAEHPVDIASGYSAFVPSDSLPTEVDFQNETRVIPPEYLHSDRTGRARELAEELRGIIASEGEDAAVARLAQLESTELQDMELKLLFERVLVAGELAH